MLPMNSMIGDCGCQNCCKSIPHFSLSQCVADGRGDYRLHGHFLWLHSRVSALVVADRRESLWDFGVWARVDRVGASAPEADVRFTA